MSQKFNEVSNADVAKTGTAKGTSDDAWAGVAQHTFEKLPGKLPESFLPAPDGPKDPFKQFDQNKEEKISDKIDGEIEVRRPAVPPATGQQSFRGIPQGENTSETTENGETLVNIKNPDGSVSQYPARKTTIDGKAYYLVANECEPSLNPLARSLGQGKSAADQDPKLPSRTPDHSEIMRPFAHQTHLDFTVPIK